MPVRTIPALGTQYHMVVVDKDGVEAASDPDIPAGCVSDAAIALIKDKVTDVFIWTHGWKGDMPAAVDQYDRWIGAFSSLKEDRKLMASEREEFKEFHIGFHWPSLEWGDEKPASGASFSSFDEPVGGSVQSRVDKYAARLGDSPAVREALTRLFADLAKNSARPALAPEAKEAYLELNKALGLDRSLAASDRKAFDPDQAVREARGAVAFGGGGLSKLLAPLQQLTFWTMKSRAQTVGENGLHALINRIQDAAPAVHIHLMGHSFGCIVTCAALGGPGGDKPLWRPVDSCVLVQGAMSLWAFAKDIPVRKGVAGYFSRLAGKVGGPTVTTRSKHDLAVGKLYPWAAGVANQISYGLEDEIDLDDLPSFGAIGAFGLRGVDIEDADMKDCNSQYGFGASKIYNLNSSAYIRKRDGLSGAHNDIDGAEVAHVVWQAALPITP